MEENTVNGNDILISKEKKYQDISNGKFFKYSFSFVVLHTALVILIGISLRLLSGISSEIFDDNFVLSSSNVIQIIVSTILLSIIPSFVSSRLIIKRFLIENYRIPSKIEKTKLIWMSVILFQCLSLILYFANNESKVLFNLLETFILPFFIQYLILSYSYGSLSKKLLKNISIEDVKKEKVERQKVSFGRKLGFGVIWTIFLFLLALTVITFILPIDPEIKIVYANEIFLGCMFFGLLGSFTKFLPGTR